MEWPSRNTGRPGYRRPASSRRAYRSCTTQSQLPFGPKYSRGAPAATEVPWPRWSWPATAKPRSVRYDARGPYRRMCSDTPWETSSTPRGAVSGTQSTAWMPVFPSAEGKTNSFCTMEKPSSLCYTVCHRA